MRMSDINQISEKIRQQIRNYHLGQNELQPSFLRPSIHFHPRHLLTRSQR